MKFLFFYPIFMSVVLVSNCYAKSITELDVSCDNSGFDFHKATLFLNFKLEDSAMQRTELVTKAETHAVCIKYANSLRSSISKIGNQSLQLGSLKCRNDSDGTSRLYFSADKFSIRLLTFNGSTLESRNDQCQESEYNLSKVFNEFSRAPGY